MTNPAPTFTIFGRDPVLIMGIVSATVMFVSSLVFPLTIDEQGILNLIAAAVLGLIGAFSVGKEKVAAAVVVLFKTLIAAALAFGLHFPPEVQGSVMAFVVALLSFYTRTQVVAKVQARF
jgi:nicotinamide riboside transporter PnuC